MIQSWKHFYKSTSGCCGLYFSSGNFIFLSKRCVLPLNIVADQCGDFMVDIFTQCDPVRKTKLARSLPACFTVSLAIVSSVTVLCLEPLCCGSNTLRHREWSVPDMWTREAGKRWHWRVMKKCLCVRGLKNSPFRVVCPLAKQRQGPVSEICCKDYLVCIMYQGDGKQDLLFGPTSGSPPST